MNPLTAQDKELQKYTIKKSGEQSDRTKQAFLLGLDASGEITTTTTGQDTKDITSLTNGSLGVTSADATYWEKLQKIEVILVPPLVLKSKLDADTPLYSRNVVFTTGNYEENKNNTVNLTNKLEVTTSSAKVISELNRLFVKSKPTPLLQH